MVPNDINFGAIEDTLVGQVNSQFNWKFAMFNTGIGSQTFNTTAASVANQQSVLYGPLNMFGTNNASKPSGVQITIIYFCGTNDKISASRTDAQLKADIEVCTTAAKAAGVDKCILCGVITRNSANWTTLDAWNAYVDPARGGTLPSGIDACVAFDSVAGVNGSSNAWKAPYFHPAQGSGDGQIHPNKIFYTEAAPLIATAMRTAGCVPGIGAYV